MKHLHFRRILSVLLTLTLLTSAFSLLTACDKEEKDGGDYENGSLAVSFPTGNIRVAINILALKLGYFDEEGVKITPVNLSGTNALTAINEGSDQLDVLTAGFVPDLQALASGYDLTFIAGTAVEGGALIAKKGRAADYQDSGKILNIDAVIGAKLGFVRNEASWIVTRQYLLDSGVPADQVAPAFFTASALARSISWFSMAQGPAMTLKLPGPMVVVPTGITESSGWNFLLDSL